MRRVLGSAVPMLAALAGCGGTSTGGGIVAPNGTNAAAVVVDAGPRGSNGQPLGYVNGVFTTVTICVPGTSNCQDVDHVLVDTGSSGLRLLANDGRAGGQLSLQLPQQRDGSGNALVECTQFLDGFTWGPIALADVKLAGETASRIPIQVISEATYSVPSSCSSIGVDESTLEGPSGLLTNGILGVGLFRQDCGDACTVSQSSGNPGLYYACSSSSSCSVAAVSTDAQVTNPVAMFASDNNGVILQLPSVPLSGAQSVSGSLVFGIDTQSNNSLGSATVLLVDNNGTITTDFNGNSYSGSFIDSGSNGIFFLSSSSTGMPTCPGGNGMEGFYCPSSTMSFSASNQGAGGSPAASFNFAIANASSLFSGNSFAFANLGGPSFTGPPDAHRTIGFDWGLSFFYGRSVYTAIEGARTSHATGPFFAY